jgi:diadenosine tetraphosphatase ApaH/serine/threonine PP2A family protein phosphatase
MGDGEILAEDIVLDILSRLKLLLYTCDTLIQVRSPAVVCGDVHGQYEDVTTLFAECIKNGKGDIGSPGNTSFIFMGDYVDRGYYSLNTFLLLATYKIQNNDRVFLLRGNHETRQITQQYGFMTECTTNYGHSGVWAETMRVFDLLPIAAVIDDCIFSVHGGISPALPLMSRLIEERRNQELPEAGILADLTWSDPDDANSIPWRPNNRGAGYIFGDKALKAFCRVNSLKFVTRSHQVVMEGFKWYFGGPRELEKAGKNGEIQGKLINVWSAPNYGYKSGNKASFLHVDTLGGRYETFVFMEAKERLAKEKVHVLPEYFA